MPGGLETSLQEHSCPVLEVMGRGADVVCVADTWWLEVPSSEEEMQVRLEAVHL